MNADVWIATAKGIYSLGENADPDLAGESVDSLQRDGDRWWAIAGGHELWRRDGSEWVVAARWTDDRLTCVAAADDSVLVGTSEAHLLRLSGGELERLESFERAEGREKWYTPWGGPPDVRSLAASNGGVLANVHVGGILRATEIEGEWAQTIDIGSDVHEVRAFDGRAVAATAVGLALSGDGGTSWSFDDDNLHATYARAVAVSGDWILMSVSLGPRGGGAAIYRRPIDSPGAFERCGGGLPESFDGNVDTGWLDSSGAVVVFGTRAGDVYLSEDSGATWERAASGLPDINHVVIA